MVHIETFCAIIKDMKKISEMTKRATGLRTHTEQLHKCIKMMIPTSLLCFSKYMKYKHSFF